MWRGGRSRRTGVFVYRSEGVDSEGAGSYFDAGTPGDSSNRSN